MGSGSSWRSEQRSAAAGRAGSIPMRCIADMRLDQMQCATGLPVGKPGALQAVMLVRSDCRVLGNVESCSTGNASSKFWHEVKRRVVIN